MSTTEPGALAGSPTAEWPIAAVSGKSCHDQEVTLGAEHPSGRGEPIRVAVVDDEELFRRGLTMLLNLEDDIDVVGEAVTVPPQWSWLKPRCRCGADGRADAHDVGHRGLSVHQGCRPHARIIMLTVSDEEADLYDAIKGGASGYLLKDSSVDEVAHAIRLVADGQSLISPSMAIKLLDEFKQISREDRQAVATPRLTERELEVLRLVAQGLNNREIGRQLFISENTVKNHVRNMLEKLQLHSRIDAVMYAVRERLPWLPLTPPGRTCLGPARSPITRSRTSEALGRPTTARRAAGRASSPSCGRRAPRRTARSCRPTRTSGTIERFGTISGS